MINDSARKGLTTPDDKLEDIEAAQLEESSHNSSEGNSVRSDLSEETTHQLLTGIMNERAEFA
jgi:hypothetical protein